MPIIAWKRPKVLALVGQHAPAAIHVEPRMHPAAEHVKHYIIEAITTKITSS